MRKSLFFFMALLSMLLSEAQQKFNGIDVNMGNLFRVSDAKSRSISPENFNGEKGKGGMATTGTGSGPSRDLGTTWKVSPSVRIKSKTTYTVAEIEGAPFLSSGYRNENEPSSIF